MPKEQEVIADFLREKVRRDDWFVGFFLPVVDGSPLTVVAVAPPGDFEPMLRYRLYGTYENNGHGKQFKCRSYVRCEPVGQAAITKYLQKAPGIGPAVAKALWDLLSENAVAMVRQFPRETAERLAIPIWSADKAEKSAEWFRGEKQTEGVSIELCGLLDGVGFPRSLTKKLIQRWGTKAAEIVRRNPFRLLAFGGCGFLKVDRLYLSLGLPPGRAKRQALCAVDHCKRQSELAGHTWLSFDEILKAVRAKTSNVASDKFIELALRAGLVRRSLLSFDARFFYYAESSKADNEEVAANLLSLSVGEDPRWPLVYGNPEFAELSDHQKDELSNALTGSIGLLVGSPGTGKTFAAARLIRAIAAEHGVNQIKVAAPTGKAAVRLNQSLAANGVEDVEAMTIHRLLGVAATSADEDEETDSPVRWTWRHGPDDPIDAKFLIIDETSMVDVDLLAAILAARATGCCVLFLGDVGQLPPVGHGAPLRDMLDSGVLPVGRLTEIRRNSGTIVVACHQIAAGGAFASDSTLDPPAGKNLKFLAANTPVEAISALTRAIAAIKNFGLADPIEEVQVLVPLNESGPLSRQALNGILQGELNPEPAVEGCVFRLGDKVVCGKNGFRKNLGSREWGVGSSNTNPSPTPYSPLPAPSECFIANGEFGRIVAMDETRRITVRFDNDRECEFPLIKGDSREIQLAYAITAHKSQGSEWPVAIVMLDPSAGAKFVASREWIYTAISRAKQVCLLIGTRSTALAMSRRVAIKVRKTFLKERLQSGRN